MQWRYAVLREFYLFFQKSNTDITFGSPYEHDYGLKGDSHENRETHYLEAVHRDSSPHAWPPIDPPTPSTAAHTQLVRL